MKVLLLSVTVALLFSATAYAQVPELSKSSTSSYDRFKDETVVSDIVTSKIIEIPNELVKAYGLGSDKMLITVKAYAAFRGKTPKKGSLRLLLFETTFLNYPGTVENGSTKVYLLAGAERFVSTGMISSVAMVRTPAGVSKNLGIGSALTIVTPLGEQAMKAVYSADKSEMKIMDIVVNLSETNGRQNFVRFYDFVSGVSKKMS